MWSKIIGCTAVAAMVTMLTTVGYVEKSEVNSLRARAKAGNPQAQYDLGLCYLNGDGVLRNYLEAYKWVFSSGTSDPERADIACKIIARKMTAAQIAEVESQSMSWQRKFTRSHLAMK